MKTQSAFDFKPTLASDLIQLRPLVDSDFDALYAVARDPQIWEQHPDRERYRIEVFQKFFDDAIESESALVVVDSATGAVIGSSRFYEYSSQRREVEIGWTYLARAYWGGQYNRELKRLMMSHAFRFVDAVLLVIGKVNTRSQKAAEKIGAVLVDDNLPRHGGINVVYRLDQEAASKAGLA